MAKIEQVEIDETKFKGDSPYADYQTAQDLADKINELVKAVNK